MADQCEAGQTEQVSSEMIFTSFSFLLLISKIGLGSRELRHAAYFHWLTTVYF